MKCKINMDFKMNGKQYKAGTVGDFSAGEVAIFNVALTPVKEGDIQAPADPQAAAADQAGSGSEEPAGELKEGVQAPEAK